MRLLIATIAATALASLATHSAEARCFWNGFDVEYHYPAPPPTAYREIYREAEPVYEPPRIIHSEVIEAPPVIYYEDWR